MSLPFNSMQIHEVTLSVVGTFTSMWTAGLRLLPVEDADLDNPVVARVTDSIARQITIARVNGIPTLIGSENYPQRLNQVAIAFQARWKATSIDVQTFTQHEA